jgi:translocation and assembly module TamB
VRGLIAGAVVLAGIVALVLLALLSPWGTRVVLAHVPGLSVAQPQGSLLGDFSARRVEYLTERAAASASLPHVVIDDLAWRGIQIERVAEASSGWGVALKVLQARAVAIDLPASKPNAAPATLPASLASPVGVRIDLVQLGSLRVSALGAEPLTDLRLRLSAQHRSGGAVRHRIDDLAVRWRGWAASGSAAVASARPFGVDATVALQSASALQALRAGGQQDDSVRLRLRLGGTLAHLNAQAEAQARGQQAQAQAELAPFADWPLQQLELRAQRFNLASLDSRAPQTLLSGELRLQPPPSAAQASPALAPAASASAPRAPSPTPGKGAQPAESEPWLELQSAWRNDAAGRWNDGRLPVRAAQLAARVAARDGLLGELRQLNVELGGGGGQTGGQIRAQGRWRLRPCAASDCGAAQPGWELQASLDQLRLAVLDAAAPPLVVSGPLGVQGPGRGVGRDAGRLTVNSELTGRVDAPGRERGVMVKLQADVADGDIQVHALQAQAGAATLALSGSAQRSDAGAGAAWRVRSSGQWSRFDPQLWWPAWFADGTAGDARNASNASSASKALSDLNGRMDVDLTWRPSPGASTTEPGRTGLGTLAAALSSLGGQASVQIERSRLHGVPLAGHLEVRTPAGAADTVVDAALELADNRLSLQGTLAHARPEQDRWRADLALRDLRQLAPLAQLGRVGPLQGAVSGSVQGTGRWPALSTEGKLQASAVTLDWRAGADARHLALQRLQADWHAGPAWLDAAAPVESRIELDGLQLGVWQVGRLRATTTGSARAHHASLALDAILPPGLAASLQPLLRRKAAEAPLQVSGQFEVQGQASVDAAHAVWSWHGQWQRVLVQPDAASVAGSTLGDQPWLRAEPFEAAWSLRGEQAEVSVSATRVSVAGAALLLRQLRWSSGLGQGRDGAAGPGGIDLDAEIEPVAAARVLAAVQPDMGWGGDLTVGGSVRLHRAAGERAPLSLDAELARRSGDLTLTDAAAEGATVSRLRLETLRLALSAHDGVWRAEQQIVGRRLGSLGGQQRVVTDPAAPWPDAHAPLEGQLDVDIADLRLWGLWVPAGWRLSGALQGRTTVSGTLQQPLLSGYLKGHQLGVRNVLEGVDFGRGELDLTFDGAQARLNRLSLYAGAGELSLTGEARLDADPEARLRLALQRFAVLQRIDRRVVLSGQADLSLSRDSLGAQGAFTVDEGLFDASKSGAPTLDDDVRRAGVDDEVSDAGDAGASSGKSPRKVNLDVLLDLGSKLRLRGYGLDTRLAGQLKLSSGPPAYKPTLRGTIKTQDGTFAAYGQKLVIDRGAINFNGALDNPGLDIEATRPQTRMAASASLTATTTDSDVRVGVTISGTAQNPRIRLFSDPEMSDTDKLSWLILGHASTGLGGADLALLQGAASALIGGDAGSVSDGLIKSIGLDEMSVRQSDSGSRETVLTVGKQISRRWYLGYERGLNTTAGTWQLIYRLAQRFTVRAQTGLDNSLDFIWVWRWD